MGVSRRESSDEEFDSFALVAWPRLRRTAYLLTGDLHLAEDLAQTALVRTYAKWGRVRRGQAHAYARTTLVNLNIDRMRRRRIRELPTDELPDGAVADRTTTEDADLVIRLLDGLTAQERRVVVLRHYCDLAESTVAHELGISIGTVKSTCSRALAKVRVNHPDYVEEELR